MDGKTTPSLDAHHHFWRYAPAEYGWIGDDMRAIRRDFLAPDLALELQATGIDHVAKPRIRDAALEPWAQEIRRLAERPHVSCKVSGLVTEAHVVSWKEEQLRPYWDVVLEAFGPRRLMFGSDWPVCLVACGYARWHDLVRGWASGLSEGERAEIFGGTACRAYGLAGGP